MIPLRFQIIEDISTKRARKLDFGRFVCRFHVFSEHRLEVEESIAEFATQRFSFVMVLHVSRDHDFGVEFTTTEIALEVRDAMDFLVFGEIAGVAEGFIAECALVDGKFSVLAKMSLVFVDRVEGCRLAYLGK